MHTNALDEKAKDEDILYELAKNPRNALYVNNLASASPHMATAELKKLASSIAANEAALSDAQRTKTPPPLDRMQSSNKRSDSGKMSVGDFRNDPFLKG